jgi:hypothetical protein
VPPQGQPQPPQAPAQPPAPLAGRAVTMRDATRRILDLEATLAAAVAAAQPPASPITGSHTLMPRMIGSVPKQTFGLTEKFDVVP